jgi:hypothetical protein
VSHQANQRIIQAAADRLGLGPEKIISLERYGNTTAATIRSRSPTPRAGAARKAISRGRPGRRGIYDRRCSLRRDSTGARRVVPAVCRAIANGTMRYGVLGNISAVFVATVR